MGWAFAVGKPLAFTHAHQRVDAAERQLTFLECIQRGAVPQ